MPRMSLRGSLAIPFVAVIVAVIAMIFLNLEFIPRGVHLAKFVVDSDYAVRVGAQRGGNWIDRMTFAPLSKLIFRHTGNYCDAPHFGDEGHYIAGDNMTIAMLVAAMSDVTAAQRMHVQTELEVALLRCDPNIVSSYSPISPLHSAILFKDTETVSTLLKYGANPSARVVRPGKSIDGMDALEFARHLECKAQDGESRRAYRDIAALISQHNATIPPPTSPRQHDRQG